MVQSDPEASEGPSARAQHQLWCVREWETSSLPPPLAFPLPKFPQTPFLFYFSQEQPQPPVPPSTGWYLAGVFFCGFFVVSLVSLDILRRVSCPVRSGHRVASVPPPSLPILPEEEWEDCRRGIAETRMFEWTKEQKARVLPPKWREILFQEHHVSLYSAVQVYLRAQSVLFEKTHTQKKKLH